jgi:hypothetical protein
MIRIPSKRGAKKNNIINFGSSLKWLLIFIVGFFGVFDV